MYMSLNSMYIAWDTPGRVGPVPNGIIPHIVAGVYGHGLHKFLVRLIRH